MTVKIDNDIPFPGVERQQVEKFPWSKLEPGQSFFVENGKMSTFYSHCRKMAIRYDGREFKAKPWTEKDKEGVRVWRLK